MKEQKFIYKNIPLSDNAVQKISAIAKKQKKSFAITAGRLIGKSLKNFMSDKKFQNRVLRCLIKMNKKK